jgi:prolyl oligopeptidase
MLKKLNKVKYPILFALITGCSYFNNFSMAQQSKLSYPSTQKEDVKDVYFGNTINDPYRWLENDTSKQTEQWVKAQNQFTNAYLEKIPYRNKLRERITALMNYPKESAPQKEGNYFVYYKNDGLQNQSVLYIKEGINGNERILIDPNTLSKDGTVALQSVVFSTNQQFVAYAVSASGSDWQEIYILDIKNNKLIKEKIEYVKFTSISWLGDQGFYYSGYEAPKDEKTKYSAKTEFQKIFFHKLGTPQSQDQLIYEDPEHPLRYVFAQVTEDQRYLVLNISEGTSGSEIKIKDLKQGNAAKFTTLIEGFESNSSVIDNIGNHILVQTDLQAPNGKVVLIDINQVEHKNWKTIIPEQKEALNGVSTGGGKLFAQYLKDACTKIVQYDNMGKKERDIELPGVGTASGFGCKKGEQQFYYSFTSFVYPSTSFLYNIKTGVSTLYKKSEAAFNPNEFESKQVFYTSKDGTKVPMFINYKKGITLNGENPTLLYAYGGFNINLTPSFSASNIAFMEQGGIYCVANLRGGGEYGEAWHAGGMLQNKQNVFDDFIAGAEFLIKEKYTSSQKLAIRGGSNGGLLVGACMTQRPELFAVAIPQVGVLDMLRYHKFTVGWGWVVEYGSSDKEDQFNYLIQYSPLHNLKQGTCYPATMITTADHDDRVVPAHSFKYAAALQEAQQCDNPTLIRIDEKAGHGAGKPTSKLIDEAADIWSFILFNTNSNVK